MITNRTIQALHGHENKKAFASFKYDRQLFMFDFNTFTWKPAIVKKKKEYFSLHHAITGKEDDVKLTHTEFVSLLNDLQAGLLLPVYGKIKVDNLLSFGKLIY